MIDSQYGTIQRLRLKGLWVLEQVVKGKASPNRAAAYCRRYIRIHNRTGKLAGKFMNISPRHP